MWDQWNLVNSILTIYHFISPLSIQPTTAVCALCATLCFNFQVCHVVLWHKCWNYCSETFTKVKFHRCNFCSPERKLHKPTSMSFHKTFAQSRSWNQKTSHRLAHRCTCIALSLWQREFMELSKVPLNICSLSTYGTFTPASKCSWELKWLLPCGTCASNLCNFSYKGYLQKWLSQQTLIIKHSHLCQQFRLIQPCFCCSQLPCRRLLYGRRTSYKRHNFARSNFSPL